jgi:hypothetical protein
MPTNRTFTCVECDNEAPFSERVSQSFSFTHKLNVLDVEVNICMKCWEAGGLSDKRRKEIAGELGRAQDGARW